MLREAKRFILAEEGVTAIEFSLLAAPLFFIVLGIIEYSIIFHLQSLATHAGNEAARMGKTGASYCANPNKMTCIQNSIERTMSAWISASRPLTVTYTSYGNFGGMRGPGTVGSTGGGGDVGLYQSSIQWRPVTPFLFEGFAEDGAVTITAYSLVKNEAF